MSKQQPVSILASIFVNNDLEVTIFQKQQLMPSSFYQHIVYSNKVTLLSQVINLMALAKTEVSSERKLTEKFLLNITKLLNDFFVSIKKEVILPFLRFVTEQFDLIFTKKRQRRYSSDLLKMSYTIFSTSARGYERLLEE